MFGSGSTPRRVRQSAEKKQHRHSNGSIGQNIQVSSTEKSGQDAGHRRRRLPPLLVSVFRRSPNR